MLHARQIVKKRFNFHTFIGICTGIIIYYITIGIQLRNHNW